MEELRIEAIGESTFCGYYNGVDHKTSSNACIPLMVDNAATGCGFPCLMLNRAKDSKALDFQLGIDAERDPDGGAGTQDDLVSNKCNYVIINVGLNDAVSSDPSTFNTRFGIMINNIKRSGKMPIVMMPNTISDGNATHTSNLSRIASYITATCQYYGCIQVNTSLQVVSMNDSYHPNPGTSGYIALGSALTSYISNHANEMKNRVRAVGLYIATFNRTAEKGGLAYWTSAMNTQSRDSVGEAFYNLGLGGNLTDSAFITAIYNNLFCRNPESSALTYWVSVMNTQSTNKHGYVMNQIIDCLHSTSCAAFSDIESYFNRVAVGLAYGYVYGKTAVAASNNLSGVTSDPSTILTKTSTF